MKQLVRSKSVLKYEYGNLKNEIMNKNDKDGGNLELNDKN